MLRSNLALRATVLVTPLLLGALAVPSGGLFRGAKFRDLHLYRQYGDALLGGHLPYRDFFVEYPPGAIPLFAGPSLAPDGAYDAIFKVLMTLCCVGAIFCVCFVLDRTGSSNAAIWTAALFLALSPIALGPVSLNTYDAWPAFLTVACLAALVTGRGRLALALLGVAAAAKLYAVLLVPVAFVWLWRERGRRIALQALACSRSPRPCWSSRGSRSPRAGSGTACTRRSAAACTRRASAPASCSPPTAPARTTRTWSARRRRSPATSPVACLDRSPQ